MIEKEMAEMAKEKLSKADAKEQAEADKTLDNLADEELVEMIFQTEKGLVILNAALRDRLLKRTNMETYPKGKIIV